MKKLKKLFSQWPVSALVFCQQPKLNQKKCSPWWKASYSVFSGAGCGGRDEEIIFVTGRGKRAIEDHFDYSFELEKT
jgi:hypothetical protein